MSKDTILLVEDTASDERLTLRALADCHLSNPVVVVRDGTEALDFLFGTGKHAGRQTSDLPRLVLLDLSLPKINGLEVLQCIRANPQTRLLPVVILTSSEDDRDMVEAYGAGANSYVRKSAEFGQFKEAVKQVALYWTRINAPPAPQLAAQDAERHGGHALTTRVLVPKAAVVVKDSDRP